MPENHNAHFFVVIVSFIIGYLVVAMIFAYVKSKKSTISPGSNEGSGCREETSRRQKAQNSPSSASSAADRETVYFRVLEIAPNANYQEIKQTIRSKLGMYHPDKVQHLGAEFQVMAHEKTTVLLEAREYFRRKYESN